MNKIHIVEKPSDIISKTLIESLFNGIGYQAIKDGLLGMIESNAKPKTVAFLLLKIFSSTQVLNKLKMKLKRKRMQRRKNNSYFQRKEQLKS